jgi:hypothetical protein
MVVRILMFWLNNCHATSPKTTIVLNSHGMMKCDSYCFGITYWHRPTADQCLTNTELSHDVALPQSSMWDTIQDNMVFLSRNGSKVSFNVRTSGPVRNSSHILTRRALLSQIYEFNFTEVNNSRNACRFRLNDQGWSKYLLRRKDLRFSTRVIMEVAA